MFEDMALFQQYLPWWLSPNVRVFMPAVDSSKSSFGSNWPTKTETEVIFATKVGLEPTTFGFEIGRFTKLYSYDSAPVRFYSATLQACLPV